MSDVFIDTSIIDRVVSAVKLLDPPVDLRVWVLWAADCAEQVLPLFEARFPADRRPRAAIEAARAARAAYDATGAAAGAAYDAAARAAADAADAADAAYDAARAAARAARAAASAAAGAAGVSPDNLARLLLQHVTTNPDAAIMAILHGVPIATSLLVGAEAEPL